MRPASGLLWTPAPGPSRPIRVTRGTSTLVADHRQPRVLNRGRRHPAIGERQPVGEMFGRLVWRHAVERHHGGRNSWLPGKLGAPAVADGHYLDRIRAACDGLFESMNGHDVMLWMERTADLTPRARRIKRSATRRVVHIAIWRPLLGGHCQRKISCDGFSTAFPRCMHRICTASRARAQQVVVESTIEDR